MCSLVNRMQGEDIFYKIWTLRGRQSMIPVKRSHSGMLRPFVKFRWTFTSALASSVPSGLESMLGMHSVGKSVTRPSYSQATLVVCQLICSDSNMNFHVFLLLTVPRRRSLLPNLVKESRDEYHALNEAQKNKIIEKYTEYKESKTSSVCFSVKSKVSDISHTIAAVMVEVSAIWDLMLHEYFI